MTIFSPDQVARARATLADPDQTLSSSHRVLRERIARHVLASAEAEGGSMKMVDPITLPIVDQESGNNGTKAAILLAKLAGDMASGDGALTFTLLATAAAICASAYDQPSDKALNHFARLFPVGRGIWLDIDERRGGPVQ